MFLSFYTIYLPLSLTLFFKNFIISKIRTSIDIGIRIYATCIAFLFLRTYKLIITHVYIAN